MSEWVVNCDLLLPLLNSNKKGFEITGFVFNFVLPFRLSKINICIIPKAIH